MGHDINTWLMNPYTGSVDTAENWYQGIYEAMKGSPRFEDDVHDNYAELIAVKKDANGDWVAA